ncbi:MAG: pseudaminic acid cytidylyltransferase [Thermodesulfobacteriota bacterium]|nr:MAG: pseudaminic acid cytidylyltransferase [Thermodesulfobacteriota bacterium]
MIAYIPARSGSKRIPNKNIKLLNGRPIITYAIETLKQLEFISDIYVSTDSPKIKDIAEKAGAKVPNIRTKSLADDKTGFMDLIKKDIPQYFTKNESKDVLFVLATAALVPAQTYNDAYEKWNKISPDILMSCKEYEKSPYWALAPDSNGFLKPLFKEMVYINSQDLPKAYTDAGLFYYFNLDGMLDYDSHKVVDKLVPYLINEEWAIDIDTIDDWKKLESLI